MRTSKPSKLTRFLAEFLFNKLWCGSCRRWRPMSINGWRCDGCAAVAAIDAVIADIYFRQSLNTLLAAMRAASSYYADCERARRLGKYSGG